MSGMVSRWVVAQEHPVTDADLDESGLVSDDALRRWVTAARRAYLERCDTLHRTAAESGLVVTEESGRLPAAAMLGRATDVLVTASATEVRPQSFTITVRVRPGGGDRDTPVNVPCVVSLTDGVGGARHELGRQIRDELIALEHSAAHFN